MAKLACGLQVPTLGPLFLGTTTPITKYSITCYSHVTGLRLYNHRNPMHPKRSLPLLYHPGVAPLELTCELVFGAKLIMLPLHFRWCGGWVLKPHFYAQVKSGGGGISLISSDIFIVRREKVSRVVETCGGRGSTQLHCQPTRPSTQVTGPEMNNIINNNNNKLVVGSEIAFVVISSRLHLRQEKVELDSCTSGCLESCDFPSGV